MPEEVKFSQSEIDAHIVEKFDQWMDNTNPDDLGILRWLEDLLPEYVPQKTPNFHKELYLELLLLFDPSLVNRFERQLLLTSYRGSAKSTIATMVLPAYITSNNGRIMKLVIEGEVHEILLDEKFIVIISETGNMAEEFVVRIRDEFSINENFRYYYKMQIENAFDDITGKWTRAAFKLNGCYILGVGIGMQVRGRIKGPSRVTLALFDDIYSEANTKTPEGRHKIAVWLENAVLNSIDDLKGKCVFMGTIVHDDTALVEFERDPLWKRIKFPLMPIDKFHKFMEEHLNVNQDTQTCVLPHDNIKNDRLRKQRNRNYFAKVQKMYDWELAWPERQNLYLIALAVQSKVIRGRLASLYQEYFHQVIPDSEKRIRKEFFVRKDFEYQWLHDNSWIKLEGENEWQIAHIEFGVDLSTGEGSDNGVITVAAFLRDNRVVIMLQKAGKFITRDDKRKDIGADIRYEKVIQDRSVIQTIGVIDESFRLAEVYHPRKIKVGIGGQEKSILRQFRQVFQANGKYTIMFEGVPQTKHEGQKVQRILDVIAPLYETRMVIHGIHLPDLEYELEFLGKAAKDDRADSEAVAFTNYLVPPAIDISFFEEVEITNPFAHKEKPVENMWRIM